jgi:hypothetical protein
MRRTGAKREARTQGLLELVVNARRNGGEGFARSRGSVKWLTITLNGDSVRSTKLKRVFISLVFLAREVLHEAFEMGPFGESK